MITVFRNCQLLRDHAIVEDDLWVRDGKILNPQDILMREHRNFDREIDCRGRLLAPGLIDLQINGAFGVDFTNDIVDEKTAKGHLLTVSKGLVKQGVTSYCPTLVTSAPEVYDRILPWMEPRAGSRESGAEVLGAHVEGPFMSKLKKGAHNEDFIQTLDQGEDDIKNTYRHLDNICIVTLAPELDGANDYRATRYCTSRGIVVSLGHSMATLSEGEQAVVAGGARLITHLFNAMAAFHHRDDPGLIGLLTSNRLDGNPCFYGIIADGIHTHPAALRIAYRTNFASLCLVTDAICAMGLNDGTYRLGSKTIEVRGERATIAGTETLCGAITTLWKSVQKLMKGARCSLVEGLEAASLHPAQAIGIQDRKGTLDFGSDADFVMIDRADMRIESTWIAGNQVYDSAEEVANT